MASKGAWELKVRFVAEDEDAVYKMLERMRSEGKVMEAKVTALYTFVIER